MSRFLSLAAIVTVLGLGGLSLSASTGTKAAGCDCCVDCAACCGDTCNCPACCEAGGCCVVNGCCAAEKAGSCSMKAGAPSCCSAK
ncbi:MAG TPA: hypothetical protein VM452_16620 [Caulifigura sp.]|nr:hypothetical protein [Caulifigura sp.]